MKSARDVRALRVAAAAAEDPLEHLARVVLHRQRRGRRAERDRAAVAAAVRAVAARAAAALLGRDLERRQRRLLADVPRRDLVDGDAAVRRLLAARRHAREPRARNDRVHGRALRRVVAEPAHDRHRALVRRERFQDRLQIEVAALGVGRPVVHLLAEVRVVHDRAVRQVEEAHARFGGRRRLRERGARRHHRAQQRQTDGHAADPEERAPRQVLLRDEHGSSS